MASIFLRNKIWWISYYPSPGENQIRKSLKTKDKTIAKFKKNELENQLVKGDNPIPDFKISPLAVVGEYVEYCKNRNKARTISDDVARIRAYFEWAKPARIKDIDESSLLSYLNFRLDSKEILVSTANHTITSLKTFLNFSVSRKYLDKNPLRNIKKFRVNKLPPRFLTKEEIQKILEVSREEIIYPMIATAIYTGMRYGELDNMKWEDIDFSRDEITVRLSKTNKFRVIPLHRDLKKILNLIRSSGKCFNYQNKRRIFKRIRKKINLSEIGWHSFRHTFASHLIMSGVDIVTVSKLLGHSSINTTMIYSHLTEGHVKEAIQKIRF